VIGRAIHSPQAPASPTYSQAVVAGNLVFVSGTVGRNMATGEWPSGVEEQADHALRNLEAALAAAGCDLSHVVNTTVFFTDPAHACLINERNLF
jgi:2-iminobutanoate/2-iminopropanoate deaminase